MEQSGTRFTEKRPVASKKKRLERDRFKDREIRGIGTRNGKQSVFFFMVFEKKHCYIYIYIYMRRGTFPFLVIIKLNKRTFYAKIANVCKWICRIARHAKIFKVFLRVCIMVFEE